MKSWPSLLALSALTVGAALTSTAQAAPMANTITVIPAPELAAQPPVIADAAARAAVKQIHVRKIILVGDSTTQVGSGWGGSFCAYHLASSVTCVDLARGGRSTFDYRAEGSWAIALNEMKTPGYDQVYVLIQFGHNDQPGRPARSTDLATEFPANLRGYITEARAAGAIPVLVTPLTRRAFKDGSLLDDLEPWAAAARQVATEMKVPLVDLHTVSANAVQAMGPRAALDFAEMAPPPDILAAVKTGTTPSIAKAAAVPAADAAPVAETDDKPHGRRNILFDYTHLGVKGANYFSAMVATELARAVPDLRGVLIP